MPDAKWDARKKRRYRRFAKAVDDLEKNWAVALKRLPSARTKLASGIGQLVLSHNYAHSSFAALFATLMHDPPTAIPLWHTQRTDRSQRELLVTAARTRLEGKRRALNAILWAASKVESLSEFRNDVVHAEAGLDVQVRPYRVEFNPWATLPSRYARLKKEVKITQSLRTASADLYKLGRYIQGIEHSVGAMRWTLPKRPRLHFVRGKHRHNALYPDTLL